MNVLVTGARGFIGSFLVEKLTHAGHEVACLLRRKPGKSWISDLNFETIPGDITDPDSLVGNLTDMEVVYHLAGKTKALRPDEFDEVNVAGTRNLLVALHEQSPGLKCFVHVSSLAAAGPSMDGHPLKENEPPQPVSSYGRSKLNSELAAQQFMDKLPVTIIRPPAVYGPRDTDVFAYFRQARMGILPLLRGGPRTASFIHVKDLVDGILLASQKANAIGKIYYLCDDRPYTWEEFGSGIARALNKRAFRITLPLTLSYLACRAGELAGKISGRPNILNLDKFNEIKMQHWVCDNSKARDELGFAPQVTLQQGLQETVNWYQKEGWL